jgi:hypothetical protein
MELYFLLVFLPSVLVLSVFGALVLHICAKYIARINSATFKQSFLVCLLSTVVIAVIWWVVGPMTLMSWGIVGIILFNLVVQAGVYIFVGKALWKCSWIESSKANALWIIVMAGTSAWTLGQLT